MRDDQPVPQERESTRRRGTRSLFGLFIAVVAIGLPAAFLYPGVRLAWEILRTPTQPMVLNKWDTMRLKSLRRSLVNNVDLVREDAYATAGGMRLSYLDIQPAQYPFELNVQAGEGDVSVAYRYEFDREIVPESPRGLVFVLHGYGMFKEAMLPWGLALAKHGYRTVLVDLPAHGASSPTLARFGRADAALLEELIRKVRATAEMDGHFTAVVGCSYGATLALHLDPEACRLESIVAIAPFGDLNESLRGFVSGLSLPVPDHAIRVAAFLVRTWVGTDGLQFRRRGAPGPSVLFLRPEHDFVTSAEQFARLVENTYPGAATRDLPGIGHMESGLPFAESVSGVLGFLDAAAERWSVPSEEPCPDT